MKLVLHPPRIDTRRAARVLADVLQLLLAAAPFLLGLAAGLLWRMVVLLWITLLWVLGAILAGWDTGRGKHT